MKAKAMLSGLGALSLALLVPAAAQDSISIGPGLPGDAIDATTASEQENNYVVDLTVFTSSFGRTYGIAPIAKGSRYFDQSPPDPLNAFDFYSNLINANSLSQDTLVGVPFTASSYDEWSGPGFGINDDPARNNPGAPVDASTLVGRQIAFGFSDFNSDALTGQSVESNIGGGFIHYTDDNPSRLFINRIQAATNSTTGDCNDGIYNYGAVDANGAVHFRGDAFNINNNCTGDLLGVSGPGDDNWIRVNMAARNTAIVNHVNDNAATGDSAATDRIVVNSADTYVTPNIIPESIQGTRPIMIGSNFNTEYCRETVANAAPVCDGTPFGALSGIRGSTAYGIQNFPALFPGSVAGTGGQLAQNPDTNLIALWGMDAVGNPLSPISVQIPAAIQDNLTLFTPPSPLEFGHYFSQTPFQGGTSQVALGTDVNGALLAAATANYPIPANSAEGQGEESNALCVYRNQGGTQSWALAAYTLTAGGGKPIEDGGGLQIGQLTTFANVTGGAVDNGPSISPPSFDSAGNIYFTSAVEIFGAPGQDSDFDIALIRANYDPATFQYRLELLVEAGQVFFGQNSQRNYQVRFIAQNDANSIASSAVFSNAVTKSAHNGMTNLDTSDKNTLGGLIFAATIIYDGDNDGQFVDGTGEDAMGMPLANTPDEDYTVLLYVQPCEDANGNGIPDDSEDSVFTSACNGDGGDQMGCTPCACGNEAPMGTIGGCLNSSLNSAQLVASGTGSIANADLRMEMMGATPNSFAVLTSGNAIAPANAANPCFGMDSGVQSAVLDGLRCAVQSTQRHGGRPVAADGTVGMGLTNGWGPPNGPPGGLAAQGGFVAGQTRHYQVFYRELPGQVCGTEQNTSQAVTVNFVP